MVHDAVVCNCVLHGSSIPSWFVEVKWRLGKKKLSMEVFAVIYCFQTEIALALCFRFSFFVGIRFVALVQQSPFPIS